MAGRGSRLRIPARAYPRNFFRASSTNSARLVKGANANAIRRDLDSRSASSPSKRMAERSVSRAKSAPAVVSGLNSRNKELRIRAIDADRFDQRTDLLRIERLDQMVIETRHGTALAIAGLSPSSQCDEHHIIEAALLPHPPRDFVAVHARHADIEEDDFRTAGRDHFKR